MSIAALNDRVRWDLATLGVTGAEDWTRPRHHPQGHVHDVVIVGGGQSGLGAAFALLRERVSNILVIDENPAGYEGPWETYARMITLRTPKHITSIDLGIPSLTFRAWYEATEGLVAWEALDKIPRGVWMSYLRWYRSILDLPVRNDTRVKGIALLGGGLYSLHTSGGPVIARKVVLATGIQGGGEWHVPPMVAEALPPHLYAHSSGPVDYGALAGKAHCDPRRRRVGVRQRPVRSEGRGGRGACLHAPLHLQRVNPIRHMERTGITGRYVALDDAGKYRFMASFFQRNQPPTNDTFDRAMALPGFHLHLGAPWLSVAETDDGKIRITTPQGADVFDFVLLSTGSSPIRPCGPSLPIWPMASSAGAIASIRPPGCATR